MEQRPLKVSVTNLALLALEQGCERCYATLARLNWIRPFVRPMPAVIHYHDKTQKWLIADLIKRDQQLPKEFKAFRNSVAVAPIGRVEYLSEKLGIKLYGYPDIVPENDRGGVYVLDNKTAVFKGDESPLYPAYQVQLNGYAWCLYHGAHDRRVDGSGLVYWQPPKDLDRSRILDCFDGERFAVPLDLRVVPVELDPDEIIPPLLKRAQKLLTCDELPEGNPDCPDCACLTAFIGTQMGMKNTDQISGLDYVSRRRYLASRRYLAISDRLGEIADRTGSYQKPAGVLPDGFLANWECEWPETEMAAVND